jgi:hypothetical protein
MNSDDFNATLADWMSRIDIKTEEMTEGIDQGLLKASIYCNGQALQLAMEMIYNVPIPTNILGHPMWKRTGLYKAAMGYGMDANTPHCALVFNAAPYAQIIEYGDSGNRQGRPIMTNSVFNNQDNIRSIIASCIGGGN